MILRRIKADFENEKSLAIDHATGAQMRPKTVARIVCSGSRSA